MVSVLPSSSASAPLRSLFPLPEPSPPPQVISSLEAPLDRPMEVDLEALLEAIGQALMADEAEVSATRFDENFRIRTERWDTGAAGTG